MLQREVTEETLHGVDAHRAVHFLAIAMALARVVADSTVHGRHGIVPHQHLPGLLVCAFLGVGEPGLDVLSRRTGVVAGGEQVHVERALRANRAGPLAMLGQIRRTRDIAGPGAAHWVSPSCEVTLQAGIRNRAMPAGAMIQPGGLQRTTRHPDLDLAISGSSFDHPQRTHSIERRSASPPRAVGGVAHHAQSTSARTLGP